MDVTAVFNSIPKDNNFINILGALGTFVLIYFTVEITKFALGKILKSFDKDLKMKGLVKRHEANTVMQDLINTALAALGGDRLQIIEYSNGNKSIALVPFEYLSITYETQRLGLEPIAKTMHLELTSLFGMFLIRLANSSSFVHLHLYDKDPSIPSNVYHYMELRGSIHSLSIPLKNPKTNEVFGYLNYDDNRERGFSEDDFKKLRGLAISVGTYLSMDAW